MQFRKKVVWKVSLPRETVERLKLIASFGGVPENVLAEHILKDWFERNRAQLMDGSLPNRLKDMLKKDGPHKV